MVKLCIVELLEVYQINEKGKKTGMRESRKKRWEYELKKQKNWAHMKQINIIHSASKYKPRKTKFYIQAFEQYVCRCFLKWNVPHKLNYLNTHSPTGGAVWVDYEPLRGETYIEEIDPWRKALRLYSMAILPVHLLLLTMTLFLLGLLPCLPMIDYT